MAAFTILQDIVGKTFTGTIKQLVASPNYFLVDGIRRNVPAGQGATFKLVLDPTTLFYVSPGKTGAPPLKANLSQYAQFYAQLIDGLFSR